MLLLARTEGVFAETAGGATLAVAKKLIEQGRIPRDEEIVLCITGNGLKTQDCVAAAVEQPAVIKPSLEAFDAVFSGTTESVLV
jgi:threonine synthase